MNSENFAEAVNILYIHSFLPIGGGGDESLFNLVKGLDRKRFNPLILTTSWGPTVKKFRKIGVKVFSFKSPPEGRKNPLLFLLGYLKLAKFIKREEIGLVHLNHQGELIYTPFVCRLLRIPCICHARSLLLTRKMGKRRRFLFNLADKIVAVSQAVKEALVQEGVRKEKIKVSYSSVDLKEFNPQAVSGETFREKFGIKPKEQVVGLIGRIAPWKGCDDFVRAARGVLETLPQTKFLLVGDSPEESYFQHLKDLVQELGILEKVIFTGFQENISQVYAALDLLVLASWEEPFARVVYEAMAMEKPVVGTRVGGTPEIIEEGVNGLLVPPKNPPLLAEAIIKILKEGKKAQEMGKAGRRIVRERFSMGKHVEEMEDIYQTLLKKRKKCR